MTPRNTIVDVSVNIENWSLLGTVWKLTRLTFTFPCFTLVFLIRAVKVTMDYITIKESLKKFEIAVQLEEKLDVKAIGRFSDNTIWSDFVD